MAIYAMVNEAKGFVANVVDWDGTAVNWQPPDGHTMVPAEGKFVGPGFTYEGGEFVPPPPGKPGTGQE